MSKDALIQVSELGDTEIVLIKSAKEHRNQLLNQSRTVETIGDAFDAECAADVLKYLSTATKEMEATRKEVKAPVMELGKRIDAVAKEFSGDLKMEETRISRLLGDYEAEQRRICEAAQRKEREAQEQARKEAEAALASGNEAKAAEAADRIAASKAVVESSAHRPSGTAVRETYQFEVTDIEALFKAAPHLCKIEPDNAAIRAAIKKSQSIAGLRIWKEAKSYVR